MRNFLLRCAAVLSLAMPLVGAAWGMGQAAERVEIRAGRHEGYQRLVLQWLEPVEHRLSRDGSVLIVGFDRPFAADLSVIQAKLRTVIGEAKVVADGRELRLTLLRDVGIKSFATGTKIVIDFLDDASAAPPVPAVGVVAGAETGTATRVVVRANEEKGRLRIVVDWPASVDYELALDGGAATVRFAAPAVLDLARVVNRSMTLATAFEAGGDTSESWLRFDLAAGAGIVEARYGGKIVLDITPGTAPAAPAVVVVAAAATPPVPVARPVATAATAAAPVEEASSPEPEPAMRLFEATARDDRAPSRVAVRGDVDPGALKPIAPTPGYFAPMLARLRVDSGESIFRFIVNRPIGLAAMVRDGRLWLAFEGRYDVAVVTGSADADAPCRDLHQVERDAGTLLTCAVPEGLGAVASREGTIWEVRLGAKVPAPAHAMELDVTDPAMARIATAGAGSPIEVAGEAERRLVFIPMLEPGTAWTEDRWLSRYLLMTTSQGVVLEIDGPGITVAGGPDGVEIATDIGLASARADQLLDPASWPVGVDPNQAERELALDPDPESRVAKRIALAQWYFSQGLMVDAQGQLGLLAAEVPSTLSRPDVRALLGAVMTRMGRLDDALALLGDPVLSGTEVELWRAVLDAEAGRHVESADRYRMISDSWTRMIDPLRTWIGIRLANGLALGGNPVEVDGVLTTALGDKPSPGSQAWASLVWGNVLAEAGDLEAAKPLWQFAARSGDRLASAEARAVRVDRLRAAGEMSIEDAIAELEMLSFAWRGDARERQRSATLVELYRQVGRDRDALKLMRAMVDTYPDAPDTSATAGAMAALFRDMMIGEASARLDPLESLAVFYEFQEFAPIEADGDDMVEQLAERLAAVDLVDKAGDLLADQLGGTITGSDRARVGTRLAEMRTATGRFQDALDALAASSTQIADEDLLRRRRVTQAASLSGLGRDDDALTLLTGDIGEAATRLRADIHWSLGNWSLAATELERLVSMPHPPSADDEATGSAVSDDALRLALAYARTGNTAGSLRTRDRLLANAEEGDPRRGILDLLTQVDGSEARDWHTLPAAVADIGAFEAFLSNYGDTVPTASGAADVGVN